jgi:hypothetical protein
MKRMGLLFCVFVCGAALFAQTAANEADFDTKAVDGGVTISKYKGKGGDIVIPATIGGKAVVGIGVGAFRWSRSLTSVTIPNSVTSIGEEAFRGCSGLKSITVAATNQQYKDIDGVLFTKDEKTLLVYPAANGKTAYVIPAGVTSISREAFGGCSGLASIAIPAGVSRIDIMAFARSPRLAAISVSSENQQYKDIDGVLFSKDGKTLHAYPAGGKTAYTIPDSVTAIDVGAFDGCSGLTSVTIPAGVAAIGAGAFLNCTGLTVVVIPKGIATINQSVFSGCTSLKSVTIPDGVTSIGYQAFWGCKSLASVTIPKSVTTIDAQAFVRCSGLTTITIPDGVTSIGEMAFAMCSSLTSITIQASVTRVGYDAFSVCDKLKPEVRADIRKRFGKAALGELF